MRPVIDSVERAINKRFLPTPDGQWYCTYCDKVFPDVRLRQTFDAHLRVCTAPKLQDGPWEVPGYPTFQARREH